MKRKINKKEKAVTLVALVVTIVILLILAGITLGMITGDNGLIKKTKQSVGAYENAEIIEKEKISELESLIDNNKENESSSSKVDNSELLKRIEELEGKLDKVESLEEKLSSLNNGKISLLSTMLNNSTAISSYDMSKFTRTESSIASQYIEYDASKKQYKVKKSGWFIFKLQIWIGQNSAAGYTVSRVSVKINDGASYDISCSESPSWSLGENTDGFTIFLPKDSYFTASSSVEQMAPSNSDKYVFVYVLS